MVAVDLQESCGPLGKGRLLHLLEALLQLASCSAQCHALPPTSGPTHLSTSPTRAAAPLITHTHIPTATRTSLLQF